MKPLLIKNKIRLRDSFTIQLTDTEEHELNLEGLKSEMAIVLENKALILANATQIENTLEQIATHHFFGNGEENRSKRETFLYQVMRSNWCTFSGKRTLVEHLISDLNDNKLISEYQKRISKVISHRNSFTHGQLTILTDGNIKLEWFEGTNKAVFLTDELMEKVEQDIKLCVAVLEKIQYKLSLNAPSHYTLTVYREKFDDIFPLRFWYSEITKECHTIPNKRGGREAEKVESTTQFIDFIEKVTQKMWHPESWKAVKEKIENLVTSGQRHFFIDAKNNLIDYY